MTRVVPLLDDRSWVLLRSKVTRRRRPTIASAFVYSVIGHAHLGLPGYVFVPEFQGKGCGPVRAGEPFLDGGR